MTRVLSAGRAFDHILDPIHSLSSGERVADQHKLHEYKEPGRLPPPGARQTRWSGLLLGLNQPEPILRRYFLSFRLPKCHRKALIIVFKISLMSHRTWADRMVSR